MSENEPTDSTFDVDAWLIDAKPPQRLATVYGRADLVAEMQAVAAEPDPIQHVMGGSDKDKRLRQLREQLDASRLVITVQGLLNADRNRLVDEHTTKVAGEDGKESQEFDALGYEEAAVAAAIVDPPMTLDQVRKLHAKVGESQWLIISAAVNAATEEPIDVPLSRLGSGDTLDS